MTITRKPLTATAADILIAAAGFTLMCWVMGSTVPDTVPTDSSPEIFLSPPAVPVPVLDPNPLDPGPCRPELATTTTSTVAPALPAPRPGCEVDR